MAVPVPLVDSSGRITSAVFKESIMETPKVSRKVRRSKICIFLPPEMIHAMKVHAANENWGGISRWVEEAWRSYEREFRGQNGSHPAVPAHQSEEAI